MFYEHLSNKELIMWNKDTMSGIVTGRVGLNVLHGSRNQPSLLTFEQLNTPDSFNKMRALFKEMGLSEKDIETFFSNDDDTTDINNTYLGKSYATLSINERLTLKENYFKHNPSLFFATTHEERRYGYIEPSVPQAWGARPPSPAITGNSGLLPTPEYGWPSHQGGQPRFSSNRTQPNVITVHTLDNSKIIGDLKVNWTLGYILKEHFVTTN